MNKTEKQAIERFVQETRNAIPELSGIILYGSMARETADSRSDIDVLVIIEKENIMDCRRIIAQIITGIESEFHLKREIKPLLTNLKDVDADFLKNVFSEGVVLYGKMLLSPDALRLKHYTLLTYDLKGGSKSRKVKISRIVHGYAGYRKIKGKEYNYNYTGIKNLYGASLVSPSTLIIPKESADKFINELKKLGVTVQTFDIWM
jgi:predicted nucleotidyltransferase